MKQLLEKLRTLEKELSESKGPFLLFALFLREGAPDVWDILVSAPWIDVDKKSALRQITDQLNASLAREELILISKIAIIEQFNPALNSIQSAFNVEHAAVEVKESEFFGFRISHAFIITSRPAGSIPASSSGGWYELNKNSKGHYYFSLKAGNNEAILRSEHYVSKSAAENGIAAVRKNSVIDSRYDRRQASDGLFYFNLRAANHQVIGTSQLYKSAESRDFGIEAVKKSGSTQAIKNDA